MLSLLIVGVSRILWERFIIKPKYSASTTPSITGATVPFGAPKKVEETVADEYDSEKVVKVLPSSESSSSQP